MVRAVISRKDVDLIIQYFSTLKHRIEHLFLPTSIDLQVVREAIAPSGDNANAWTELQQIFAMRKDKKNYYQNRLNRASDLLLGGLWRSTPEEPLPTGQSMLDFVKQEEKEESREWEKLYKLLGLQKEKGGYVPNADSPIRLFCKQMDWLKANPPDEAPSISTVLDFFAEKRNWTHADFCNIKTFDDWFSTLIDTMAALRDRLGSPMLQ